MNRRVLGELAVTVALTVPWLWTWVTGTVDGQSALATVATSGVAVLGASFLLTWGAETAEADVPRAFAIAVLAVLAVAPEYAVDALYAWTAGQFAGTQRGLEAGNLAVANMTGANRILIGVGWASVALFTILRARAGDDPAVRHREGVFADAVALDRDVGLELLFLLAATLWAFLVPLGGGIDAVDAVVLVGLYVAYIVVVLRGDAAETDEHVGVPAHLQELPFARRAGTVVALFAYSGLVIFTAVEPFAHGLEHLGTEVGVPAFFMIQWIAPLASESPELVVVTVLVTKARSTAGFNALISSKLNQWTLLIGTLVVVYSLALGGYGTLPFDRKQAAEIWLTAAQSLFAVALVVDFEISVREALALLVLFVAQVLVEFLLIREVLDVGVSSVQFLLAFTAVYVVAAGALFVARREALARLLGDTSDVVTDAIGSDAAPSSAD